MRYDSKNAEVQYVLDYKNVQVNVTDIMSALPFILRKKQERAARLEKKMKKRSCKQNTAHNCKRKKQLSIHAKRTKPI